MRLRNKRHHQIYRSNHTKNNKWFAFHFMNWDPDLKRLQSNQSLGILALPMKRSRWINIYTLNKICNHVAAVRAHMFNENNDEYRSRCWKMSYLTLVFRVKILIFFITCMFTNRIITIRFVYIYKISAFKNWKNHIYVTTVLIWFCFNKLA